MLVLFMGQKLMNRGESMIHKMGLYEEYLDLIKAGKKTVEVRLNDEKRRKVKAGDLIEFTKVPEENEKIQVKVTGLKVYANFQAMYEAIPFQCFGGQEATVAEMVAETYDIYTPEQEKEWGTLAIEIDYIK